MARKKAKSKRGAGRKKPAPRKKAKPRARPRAKPRTKARGDGGSSLKGKVRKVLSNPQLSATQKVIEIGKLVE